MSTSTSQKIIQNTEEINKNDLRNYFFLKFMR